MSNKGYNYIPEPPRAWNRFENPCAYFTGNTNPEQKVYIPFFKESMTQAEFAYRYEMYKKGNILQYKANSSNLTKQQRYSQIARGMWTNRTTTWASQSETYSNPNTQSLKRVNYGTTSADGGPIGPDASLCVFPIINPQYNVLPATVTPGSVTPIPDPVIPPIIPPVEPLAPGIADVIMPPYVEPAAPEPTPLIADGGSLICSIIEDFCTGEIIKNLGGPLQCVSTTASDVPGEPQELCWNDGLPTYYPRERRTYGTSGDKWPVNYKEFVPAVKPDRPILTIETTNTTNLDSTATLTLSWEFIYCDSVPIVSFLLFQNGIFILEIDFELRSITLTNLPNCTNLDYFLIAHNTAVDSEPSNTVSIYFNAISPPILEEVQPTIVSGETSVTLNWIPTLSCPPATSYKIYQDGLLLGSTSSTTYTVNGLSYCTTYNFNVTAISELGESNFSNTVTLDIINNWYLSGSIPNQFIYTNVSKIYYKNILINPNITTITPDTCDNWENYETSNLIANFIISAPVAYNSNTDLTGGVLGSYWQLISGVLTTSYPIYFKTGQIKNL